MKNRNRICGEYCGFTLAEVLITIGIIGVVASLVMPSFMESTRERTNSERQVNIVQKVTHAMEHMRATGKLTSYESTEAFVNELKKHLKIAKVCDSNHLRDCWTSDKMQKGDTEISIADLKGGNNLHLGTDTNNIGIVLADGAHIILNYNPTKGEYDVGDRVTTRSISLPVGKNKTKDFTYTTSVTDSVAFIMDVNGKQGPNQLPDSDKLYDVRTFNCKHFSGCDLIYEGECLFYLGTGQEAVERVSNMSPYTGRIKLNWDNSYSDRPYYGRILDPQTRKVIEQIRGDKTDFDSLCQYYKFKGALYNPKSGLNGQTLQLLTYMIANAEFINAPKGYFTTARTAVQKYILGRATDNDTIIKLPVVCK